MAAQANPNRWFYIENHTHGCSSVVQATDKKQARSKYIEQFPEASADRFTAYVIKDKQRH